MGSGASTAPGPTASAVSAECLLDGFADSAPERTVTMVGAMAQDRLQKVAFDGDKPSWKDSFREYNIEHGVNKVAKVDWSDQTAPPKQKSFSSCSSSSSSKGSPMPRSKPININVHSNPNIGKSAPPPNAGRSPSVSHHTVVQSNGQTSTLAPSALGRPEPPFEGAPDLYSGRTSQRTIQSTASTVYSVASPVAGRHADMNGTQTQRRSIVGKQQPDPGGGRSPLIGNNMKKPSRPSTVGDVDTDASLLANSSQFKASTSNAYSTSNGTGSKPPPPAGTPPRKLSRGDSEVDGDNVLMADFSQSSSFIAENMAISTTAARGIPSLNLTPVAAQTAIRNQPAAKPGAMGLHTKIIPGLQLHSNYSLSMSTGSGRPLPSRVAPPSGTPSSASSAQRSNSRPGPLKPTTPASVHAAGGGDLVAKKFPHSVKETSDVKRNRAQIPTQLTHAKPTTGDWLKKRYIVNNYILLDTLGTGSYGEVVKFSNCLLLFILTPCYVGQIEQRQKHRQIVCR